jgi:hypothetical protein
MAYNKFAALAIGFIAIISILGGWFWYLVGLLVILWLIRMAADFYWAWKDKKGE